MSRKPLRCALVAGLIALCVPLAACGTDEPPDRGAASPTAAERAQPGPPSAVIAVERAQVFPQPDRNSEPLTYLFEREQVPVRGQSADGAFWAVTVDGREGWILAAQADLTGDPAQLAVIDRAAGAETATLTAAPSPELSPPATLTAAPTEPVTPRPSRTPTEPAPTATARPTSAAIAPDRDAATPTEARIFPGTPPPLTLDLPAGWEAAHVLLPFRTPVTVSEVPMSLYEGPLPGGATGHLFLFWGFPNVTGPSGKIDLWTDALQILRGSLVDQSCNLGIDLEPKTYTVGEHDAVGSLFSAVDCEGEPDTAGYFAALQVAGGNFAFYFAVEPPGAFADQFPALQAVLESVRFDPA